MREGRRTVPEESLPAQVDVSQITHVLDKVDHVLAGNTDTTIDTTIYLLRQAGREAKALDLPKDHPVMVRLYDACDALMSRI